MPTSLSGQLFETVGLEIEGTLMSRQRMSEELLPKLSQLMGQNFNKITLDRDASVESYAETMRLGGKYRAVNMHSHPYKALSSAGSGNTDVYGYEFKTVPIEIKDLKPVLYPLIYGLYDFGDVISDRASIHSHVGYANNFRMLKSYLAIMLNLEPVLYRLGGMGGTFRGHLNNAAYCRPLLNSCVVPVAKGISGKYHAQIVNAIAARDSQNIHEFWAAFGIDNTAPSQSKYHPSRYAGANFFALYSHGTAEWRYFNKSFNVPLVIGITKLHRSIVETSALLSPREIRRFDVVDSSKEISYSDAEGILSMLVALCHDKDVGNIPDDNEMALILETIKDSHFEPLPEVPTFTHIRDFNLSDAVVKKGHLKTVEEYLPTTYVDIHNIGHTTMPIIR